MITLIWCSTIVVFGLGWGVAKFSSQRKIEALEKKNLILKNRLNAVRTVLIQNSRQQHKPKKQNGESK